MSPQIAYARLAAAGPTRRSHASRLWRSCLSIGGGSSFCRSCGEGGEGGKGQAVGLGSAHGTTM